VIDTPVTHRRLQPHAVFTLQRERIPSAMEKPFCDLPAAVRSEPDVLPFE
jgi:hypothetical protein